MQKNDIQINPLLTEGVQQHKIDFSKIRAKDFNDAIEYLLPLAEKENEEFALETELDYDTLFNNDKAQKQLRHIKLI